MCGLSGQFVDSTVLILKSEVCRTAFSQNRSWLKSFLQGAYLFGAKIGSFGGIFAMKKTIALFAAVLMLLCAVPFAAIGEMNLAAAKTAGDFPDAVFDPLGDAASVEYSHNTNFTGESGTEFVSDGENGIKSASGGMRSSVVTITITFGEAVSNARLSFDYKVSSEARYDYLSVNGSTEKTLSGEIDWTNYSQAVTAGSVVTLAYVKDSSGDKGSDCVWFKNFALQSLGTVTFENVDPLAVLTVRNAEGNIENPTANSNVYALAAGDYSYTLTRFGYQMQSGEFTVSGDMSIELGAMTELETCTINFSVTPAEASVTLTHPTGGEMQADENGAFVLPKGEVYSYTVSAANYVTANGSFTASADAVIEVELTYAGEAWDGTTVTQPAEENGVYMISDAAEFEWFAQFVNAGNSTANAVLTQNINFNGKARTAFGIYDYADNNSGYNGTFDGRGFAVTGIAGEDGILDCIGPDGVVKNIIANVNIASDANIGGIANTSKGLVENCLVAGSVSTSANYCSSAGIVGRAMTGNTVRGCVNNAAISNTTNSYASTLSLGGIVGYTYGTVENCYNTGSLSAKQDRTNNKGIGGIAGQIHAPAIVRNVYNVGSVIGPEAGIGGIAGVLKGTLQNAYFLEGTASNGVSSTEGTPMAEYASKTAEEMRSAEFAAILGEAFNNDTDGINGGMPVLTWQGGSAEQPNEIEVALLQYPELIRDFVDKTQTVDMNALMNDIQLPRPSTLEDAGILTDRSNQKVLMESMNTDAFEFYGYHGIVYRPLPGSPAVTVQYRISVQDRNTEEILGSRVFELTILPLTEAELAEAEQVMQSACTEEVYWNGIKGENANKDSVTANLAPFSELVLNENGGFDYIRGAVNITFGGIDVDDLPGYDPMSYQPWREFRSSHPSIITCENLLVTRPEYDTLVTIDSVFTYTKYAKYWEKFGENSDYARFEAFFKQPVSVTVKVLGTSGSGTVEDITATVRINGRNFAGFTNPAEFTFTAPGDADSTVWDAISAALDANGCTFDGDGYLLRSVTDVNGVTLSVGTYGEACGWFYKLNGEGNQPAAGTNALADGDVIELFYTDNNEAEGIVTLVGDVNGDGIVTVVDALMLLRCALGTEPTTAAALANGDIDGDGVLSAEEALAVMRMAIQM